MEKEGKRENIFERNPVKTVLVLLAGFFLAADLGAGTWLHLRARGIGESHPYYHHGLRRSSTGRRDWGGMTRDVSANSLGFIDSGPRGVDPGNKAGLRRVLLLGDSFGEGVGVPYEETFAGLLQARLGPGYEVLNASVASYSPKLYYLRLKYLLEQDKLAFDRLYVLPDISDVQDEVMYEYFQSRLSFPFYQRVRGFLRDYSVTVPFLYSRLGVNRISDTEKRTQFELWGSETERYKERSSWLCSAEVRRKWGEKGLASARDYMGRLAALCRERGIPLTIGVYPWPEQVLRGEMASLQVRFWRDLAREQGAGFLDLSPVFVGKKDPARVVKENFIEGDVHWNAAGHRAVAEALYRRISSDFASR